MTHLYTHTRTHTHTQSERAATAARESEGAGVSLPEGGDTLDWKAEIDERIELNAWRHRSPSVTSDFGVGR
jgi:hypothetical protein